MAQALKLRSPRSLESTFFLATFIAAIATVSVSASTILPCPASGSARLDPSSRGAMAEEQPKDSRKIDRGDLPAHGLGQRALLTRRGGWIEIEERPSLFSWRRWTS